MIVLDTTVLVDVAIAEERIEATTTAEVIQAFVHVRARRRDRGDAALGRDYAELLCR